MSARLERVFLIVNGSYAHSASRERVSTGPRRVQPSGASRPENFQMLDRYSEALKRSNEPDQWRSALKIGATDCFRFHALSQSSDVPATSFAFFIASRSFDWKIDESLNRRRLGLKSFHANGVRRVWQVEEPEEESLDRGLSSFSVKLAITKLVLLGEMVSHLFRMLLAIGAFELLPVITPQGTVSKKTRLSGTSAARRNNAARTTIIVPADQSSRCDAPSLKRYYRAKCHRMIHQLLSRGLPLTDVIVPLKTKRLHATTGVR